MSDDLLSPEKFGKHRGFTKKAVQDMLAAGRIPAAKLEKVTVERWLIPADSEILPGKSAGRKRKPDSELRRPRRKS